MVSLVDSTQVEYHQSPRFTCRCAAEQARPDARRKGSRWPRLGPDDETMVGGCSLSRCFGKIAPVCHSYVCSYLPALQSIAEAGQSACREYSRCEHDSDICFASVRAPINNVYALHFVKPCIFDFESLYTSYMNIHTVLQHWTKYLRQSDTIAAICPGGHHI